MWASTPMHSERQSWRSWTIKRLASYHSLSLSLSLSLWNWAWRRNGIAAFLRTRSAPNHAPFDPMSVCLSTNLFAKRVLEFALNLPWAVVTTILFYKKHETATKLVLRFCSTIRSFCMLQLGCYTARGSVKLLFVLLVPVWNAWMNEFTDGDGHSRGDRIWQWWCSASRRWKNWERLCVQVCHRSLQKEVSGCSTGSTPPCNPSTAQQCSPKEALQLDRYPQKTHPKTKTHTHTHTHILSLSLSTFP